jgi:[protein-PII] uridylyltransferase
VASQPQILADDDGLLDAERFDADLLAAGDRPLPVFSEALKQGGRHLERAFDRLPAHELVHGRARLLDALLVRAWRLHLGEPDDLALLAVGGYGRGELLPGSDIDLLILADDAGVPEHYHDAITAFLTFLWDMGLEIGHSVRTAGECTSEGARDVTVLTNLLEARLLVGRETHLAAVREAISPERVWPSRDYFEAKLDEQERRHARFNDTAYNLEPNLKEGPGGLRDIQTIGWVAKRHFGASTLAELVDYGFLTCNEYRSLKEGQEHLWRVRFALHTLTRRGEDRLLFDLQQQLALRFGYQDGPNNLAVEQFMQRYYRTIQELERLNEMLLNLFREAILYEGEPGYPVIINQQFQLRHGYLEARHPEIFSERPSALLEMFVILAQHPEFKGVSAATLRLVREACELIDEDFRAEPRNRTLFIDLLRQPTGITHALRRMNRYGVLAAYLPAFGKIVGRMQYDLFHTYTVDEHILFVIRNLRRFSVPKHAEELPLCSAIFASIPQPALLYLAALFHDISKGQGGDHSELGEQEAMRFCLEHGLGHHEARLVAWLVRHHLLMSITAQRQDISDPEVIHRFAQIVGDVNRLDHLYLLTVADIRATNPTLWNNWKDALLTTLYQTTKRALNRGLEEPIDREELIRETKDEACELLKIAGVDPERVKPLWTGFAEEYFLSHFPHEIAWHCTSILEDPEPERPLILLRQTVTRHNTEIFIYTRDQHHVFARATATLERLGLNVLDARIISAPNGYTLDTFVLTEDDGSEISEGFRVEEILTGLTAALSQTGDSLPRVDRQPARRLRYFKTPTKVVFSQDRRNGRTVLELDTSDRPGLLSRVGRVLVEQQVKLQNAKIATIGERANDVFFITDRTGAPVLEQSRLDAIEAGLHEALDKPDS